MLPKRHHRNDHRYYVNRGLIAESGIIPTGLQLIRDVHSLKILKKDNVVAEDRHGKPVNVMKVTGLFQECDKENANGRIYPFSVMKQAVQNIQEDISSRAVIGELDHPVDAKIHLDRISHLVTKIWMEGKKVYGEAEILDNQPHGACLRGLFERNVRTGISSRGVGDMELTESGNGKESYTVLDGYAFITWDAVCEPSVRGATLNVMESLNRKLKPIRESKNVFSREVYQEMLVKEIKKYFEL